MQVEKNNVAELEDIRLRLNIIITKLIDTSNNRINIDYQLNKLNYVLSKLEYKLHIND